MRIGVVAYANTLPLAHGLERHLPGVEIVRSSPARVADGLESGSLGVGIVPVAALAAHPEWKRVPGLGIASLGPVRSVALVAREALTRVERFVEDPASRTSNVLARLWLEHRIERRVEVVPGNASWRERLREGEATVVIGDDALFLDDPSFERFDLGEAWTEWTRLPFVYALWAGPQAGDPEVVRALSACHEENAARLDELGRVASPEDPARAELFASYLRDAIRYRIGEEDARGLDRFLAMSERLQRRETTHAGA